jgi:predicted acylesterase/phospholipase RssA
VSASPGTATSGPAGRRYDVNGVFEGSGAKGVVYVGALQACRAAGLDFRAVAGSSAGAITAALVASGHDPAEIEDLLGRALASFGRRSVALVSLRRRSVLASATLRAWLSATIDGKLTALGHPGDGTDRTFRDVEEATGISLYVVTMDLGSRQPIVFCPTLTPDAPVADAVMASSAIPVAFPAQRVEIGGEVRRLADGGVYANYPSFVFLDDEFRRCFDLPDAERNRATVGFVLDAHGAASDQRGLGRDQLSGIRTMPDLPSISDRGSAERDLGMFGGLVTSPLVRLAAVLLPVVLVVLGFGWAQREFRDGMPTLTRIPRSLQDVTILSLTIVTAFLVGFAVAMAFAVLRLGRALVDEGVVGASAAMGVGPNVPYWVGAHPTTVDLATRSHVVVRIPLPPDLKTLGFRMKPQTRDAAVANGRRAALEAFARYGVPVPAVAEPATAPPAHAAAAVVAPRRGGRARQMAGSVVSLVLFAIGFALATLLSLAAIRAGFDGSIPWWQLGLLLVVGAALLAFHGLRRHRRAAARATFLDHRSSWSLLLIAAVSGVAGLGLVAFVATTGNDAALNIGDQLFSSPFVGTVLQSTDRADGTTFHVDVEVSVASFPEGFPRDALDNDIADDHVGHCDAPDGSACFVFNSDHSIDPGSQALRYVDTRGIVVREADLWFAPFSDTWVLLAAVPFLLLAVRAASARRARRRLARFEARRVRTRTDASLPPPVPAGAVRQRA